LTGPGNAGDYYNPVTTNGICQICHTQTDKYTRVQQGAVNTHNNTAAAGYCVTDFLSETGRRCTECHLHDGGTYPMDRGFKVPSIKFAENNNPLCEDCHLWDPTANNDDIDNYTFGTANINPLRSDFSDRAMIDGKQYCYSGHGTYTVDPLLETSKGTKGGPQLICTDCHTEVVEHGDLTNPYRLIVYRAATDGEIITQLCYECHAGTPATPSHGKTRS